MLSSEPCNNAATLCLWIASIAAARFSSELEASLQDRSKAKTGTRPSSRSFIAGSPIRRPLQNGIRSLLTSRA